MVFKLILSRNSPAEKIIIVLEPDYYTHMDYFYGDLKKLRLKASVLHVSNTGNVEAIFKNFSLCAHH